MNERQRDRERDKDGDREVYVCVRVWGSMGTDELWK